MSKRPHPGRCIHCLKNYDVLTWDHVLPDSWYPQGAKGFKKWEAPSCEACNETLGKIEENLMIKLGLCLDPKGLGSLGIPDKVLRSLSPEFGKNNRDRIHRQSKRDKVLKEAIIFKELPKQGIFPGFSPLPGLGYKEYPSVTIDQDEITKFAEKITRGIAYIADKSFIEDTYKIELFILDEEKAAEIRDMIETNGISFDRKPGLFVKRLLVENDKVGGFYFIEIWEQFRMYVIVSPIALEKKVFGA